MDSESRIHFLLTASRVWLTYCLCVQRNDLRPRIFEWVKVLVLFLRQFPRDATSRVIVSQLIRSGTSVGANYCEAQAGSSRKDFANFVQHSLKSARESDYWLQLSQETIFGLDKLVLENLRKELDELIRILVVITVKTK